MKERRRMIFQCHNQDSAKRELESWISEAQSSGIKILKDAAMKLRLWRRHILNWYNYPISTSKIETANRKIATLQRNAYGYRDNEYFELRIYNMHNSNYSLTG